MKLSRSPPPVRARTQGTGQRARVGGFRTRPRYAERRPPLTKARPPRQPPFPARRRRWNRPTTMPQHQRADPPRIKSAHVTAHRPPPARTLRIQGPPALIAILSPFVIRLVPPRQDPRSGQDSPIDRLSPLSFRPVLPRRRRPALSTPHQWGPREDDSMVTCGPPGVCSSPIRPQLTRTPPRIAPLDTFTPQGAFYRLSPLRPQPARHAPRHRRHTAGLIERDVTCGLADWGLEIWHHG